MANQNRPFGLEIHRGMGSAIPATLMVQVTAANAVFVGDVLRRQAAGTVIRDATPGTNPSQIMGVAQSYVGASDVNRWVEYYPASPELYWLVQADTMAAANMGACADMLAGVTPTATFEGYIPWRANVSAQSGMYLSNAAVTAGSAQLRIVELARIVGNEWGAYAKVVVQFAESAQIGGSGV